MLNRIVLQGRMTKDPEVKTTNSNAHYVSFGLACERPRYNNSKETDFLNLVAWNKTADFIGSYFHKGDMMIASGRLQTRKYEDTNGVSRTVFEILVDEVNFCGGQAEPNQAATTPAPASNVSAPVIADGGDMPFLV